MATREVSDRELLKAKAIGCVRRCAGSDYLMKRALLDGRVICLLPLVFGASRLGIGAHDSGDFDDVWDFASDEAGVDCAFIAAIGWDGEGEPEGWYRHPTSGRRSAS